MEEKKIAYKGFDKDLKCVKCCERGFHACESPLEVFDHYDMITSRFAKVEQSGDIDKEENTTKVCSSKIKIKAELNLADIVKLGVEWIKDVTSPSKLKKETDLNDNGGYSAKIGSSGYSAQIESTGNHSVVMAAGNNSIAKAKIGSWITLAEWDCEMFFLSCFFVAFFLMFSTVYLDGKE